MTEESHTQLFFKWLVSHFIKPKKRTVEFNPPKKLICDTKPNIGCHSVLNNNHHGQDNIAFGHLPHKGNNLQENLLKPNISTEF